MSERSKGDVSRVNNNTNRIVKNPLLSASVTGLSFDDFPNKPLLLPAAPPVVHAPPPQPTNAVIAGILNREPKTLVTVGQPSSIDESEALDEINLNASSSDDSTAASVSYQQQRADANANPLLEPPPAADSLLSQAASSFGALPSVASNVFSTFSKRLYAGARESDESSSSAQPQLEIQPTYIQPAGQIQAAAVAPPPFYAAPATTAGEAVPEPPKFYAPTEVPGIAAGAGPLPPPTAGQNTYRISARKKLYAPIPGLSEQQSQPLPAPGLFQAPPYPPQTGAIPAYEPPAPPVQEERKPGGLFSLTSLVPTGVLQNISGLVQSATGRTTEQPAPPASYNAPNPAGSGSYFEISTAPQTPANYFAPVSAAPPTSAGYFVPTEAPPTAGSFLNPLAAGPNTSAPPTVGAFFTPNVQAPTVSQSAFIDPPQATQPGVFTGQLGAAAQPPISTASESHIAAQPPISAQSLSNQAPAAQPPSAQPPSAQPPSAQPPSAQPSIPAQPPSAQPSIPAQPPSAQPSIPAQPPAAVQQASVDLIPTYAQAPAVSQPSTVGESTQAFGPPPTPASAPPPAATVPPPSAGAGQSSYRLQKGTRLYKSPLTAQETAAPPASFGQNSALAPTPYATYSAPAAIFNPFGGAQATEVALFAPPQASSSPSVAGKSQEVPLFAAATTGPTSAPATSIAATAPPSQSTAPPPATAAATSYFTPQTPAGLFQAQEATPSAPPSGPPSGPSAPATSVFNPQASTELFKAQESSAPASSLFASVPGQTQSPEFNSSPKQAQSVPLFAAPTQPVQETPLFSRSETLPAFSQGSTAALFAPQADAKPESQPIPSQLGQEGPQFRPPSTVAVPPSSAVEPTDQKANTVVASESATAEEVHEPSAPAEPDQETGLFVPVPPPASTSDSVDLYPPVAATTSSTEETPVTAAVPTNEPQPTRTGAQAAQPAPASTASNLFSTAEPTGPEQPSVALTTQTTTTFFNPFEQTITTPLPQELLSPPIGFATPSAQAQADSLFAAQTIEPVLTDTEAAATAAAPLPPPPTGSSHTDTGSQANPFRRASVTAVTTSAAPPALLSFFTPAPNSSDFGFFGASQETTQPGSGQFPELPPATARAESRTLTEEPPVANANSQCSTHGIGFEQLIRNSQQATPQTQNSKVIYQNSCVNTFSGFFGVSGEATVPAGQPQTQPQSQPLAECNTVNFFDHFSTSAQRQEDQRIQNFFNNPPLQDQPAVPGDLKYDLVHSGLPSNQFQHRSQASVSNIVEPASSACSEFSAAAPPTGPNPAATEQAQSHTDYLLQHHQAELPEEILQQLRMAHEKNPSTPISIESVVYTPVLHHWFYKRIIDGKFVWTPFSHYDSALLETSLNSEESDSSSIVAVEGGRYDVNIKERTKIPVYWEGKAIEVRRCSWFYKAVDGKYVPYPETTAEALEMEYKRSTETNEWQKKIKLGNGEQVTMHGPNIIVHFMASSSADTWGASVQSSTRPLVVKRDLDDFKIQQGESQRVDHLLFMVHGIGSACDLKMRNVEEVVDDFRYIAQQLVQSHYKNSIDMGLVGRVEVLPIEWHGHLHSEELGIDEKLKSITLESIPRLRNFTNDTLLDVLFYTSPKYCQKIMNTVADALNEVYLKYRMRHPEFNGGVSLAGHSLGSLILFDLLCHQEPLKESEEENKENPDQLPHNKGPEVKNVQIPNNDKMLPKQVSYAMGIGPAGTGQPVINYTQLIFHPKKFFALGSPVGMFVTIRGIDKLGLDFRLPTCPGFYNIFHPFDPVAYRIEALVNPDMKGIRPVLIPHHKGRKRMHLELKETMTRVGADIKQRFMDTFKTTLDSVNFLATVTRVKKEAEESLEKEVSSSNSQIFQKQSDDHDDTSMASTSVQGRNRTDSESTTTSDPEFIELDFPLGKLNDSKRVDYVLQEAPLEFINEYIFALSSHVCYWGSEDTILFVMKEIYAGLGISTDSQVPQQSMTIERPSSRSSSISQTLFPM